MNKVRFHTVDQPASDTTTFVLSCNRLDVLDQTLKSFYNTRDYITKMVIVDDSAEPGVFEKLVERYGHDCDIICFPRNRSQWWGMDFMVSYCDSDYIFYLEDDWEFLQSGYLNASKSILQRYRDIGTIDISWRTFEKEGFETYDKTLIDNQFYYKKLWRISDYHYHWYGWIGSPNLKRRDDLILLGRVEKWHNEWNIDRRFLALGLKAVYLNGRYVDHLGDYCSRMDGKRPSDATTPEDYYPQELKKNRTYPVFDYLQWDKHWKHPYDITIVSAFVDLDRKDRDESHYLKSLENLLKSRHPIFLFCDEKYFEIARQMRGGTPLELIKFDKTDIENLSMFKQVQAIVNDEKWINQADWLKNSVNRDPYYICLTFMKQKFLQYTKNKSGSTYYYWVDSGVFSSYKINENINEFSLTKIPKDRFFITSFDYAADKEIHGFNIEGMTELCNGVRPNYVCRATVFGGTKYQIDVGAELFDEVLRCSLNKNLVGTEESIYTIISHQYPLFFNRHNMPNGSIYNFLRTIK